MKLSQEYKMTGKFWRSGQLLLCLCVVLFLFWAEAGAVDKKFSKAITGLRITNSRWVDVTTLETAINDIFRLEKPRTEQERALALWRWFRVLVDPRGFSCYEGPSGKEKYVKNPHKLLTVFGSHHCDGLSRMMSALWKASGRIAFKGFAPGNYHSQSELFYRDDDGIERFHMFDARQNYFVWNRAGVRILSMADLAEDPVMGGAGPGWIHCHAASNEEHNLFRQLVLGESVEYRWDSDGYILRRKIKKKAEPYYEYKPDEPRPHSIMNVAGVEVQTLKPDSRPAWFKRALHSLSKNVTASSGVPLLHAEDLHSPGIFIYQLSSPFIAVDGTIELTCIRETPRDICRVAISCDNGVHWHDVYDYRGLGKERVNINIGRKALEDNKPNVNGIYDFLVRIIVESKFGEVQGVGFKDLCVTVYRQLNKRTLPNLREGDNRITVDADAMLDGFELEVSFCWREGGDIRVESRKIDGFPYTFIINTGEIPISVAERGPVPHRADKTSGRRKLEFLIGRMESISMRLVPASAEAGTGNRREQPEQKTAGLLDIMGPLYVQFPRTRPLPTTLKGLMPVVEKTRSKIDKIIALEALAGLGTEQAVNYLYKRSLKGDRLAILSMAKLKDKRLAVEYLSRLIDNPISKGRIKSIIQALGLCRSAHGTEKLLELYRKDRKLLCLTQALKQTMDPKAFDAVLDKFSRIRVDKYNPVGWLCIQAMVALDGDRAFPVLLAALPEANSDFTWHIARGLGRIGNSQAILSLMDKLRNAHPPGRWAIIEALGVLRAKEAIVPLKQIMKTSSAETSFYVSRALEKITVESNK